MYTSMTDSKERFAGKPLIHHDSRPGQVETFQNHNNAHTPLNNIIGHITQTTDMASLHMYCQGLISAFNIEHYEIFASIRQPFSDVRLMHIVNGREMSEEEQTGRYSPVSAAAFQEYCLAASLPKLWTSHSNTENEFVAGLLQYPHHHGKAAPDEYLLACIPWHGSSGNAGGLAIQCHARDKQRLQEMEATILKLAFLTPYILEAVARFVTLRNKKVRKGVLTDREKDVLYQLALGHSTADVAKILGISINTVTTHTRKIHEKLQVNNRQQAVIRAINMNLISLA